MSGSPPVTSSPPPARAVRKSPVVSKKRGFAIGAVMALLFIVLVGNMYFGVGTIKEIQKLPQRYWRRANQGARTFAPWQVPQSLVFNGLEWANHSVDPLVPKGVIFKTSSPVGMTENLLCDRYCHLDVVYTWVNGSDIPFKFKKFSTVGEVYKKDHTDELLRKYPLKMVLNRLMQANSQDKENDELKASMRGMKTYMRWHRGRTVVVSPGHVPYWMDQRRAFFGVSFTQGQRARAPHTEALAWWSTPKNARTVALAKHYLEDQFNEGQGMNDRKHAIVKGEALPHDLVTVKSIKRTRKPTPAPGDAHETTEAPAEFLTRKMPASLANRGLTENPRFVVVYQDVLVPEHRRLRFSSNVVEPVLHKVPDVSNVFVHMNDDYLIMNHTKVSTFVNKRGGPNLFFESGVMRGGKPQWEQTRKAGGKTWVCGVFHTHAVIKDILDNDVGANSRYRQIFGYVRYRNGTNVEGNLTTRFFAKHSPFVYNKKVLAYLDQYEVAGKYYDTVNVRGRHCDDVYVPFIHHAIAIDAPWRGCLNDIKSHASNAMLTAPPTSAVTGKFLTRPTILGLGMPHFVRNESQDVVSLSKQVQCPAPATMKLGKAAENVFMMLKDNETEMRRGLNQVLKKDFTVRFVTINDGFRNASMGRMLQHWLHYHFPRPTSNERPLYLPGQENVELSAEADPLGQHKPTNDAVLMSLLQDYFGLDLRAEVSALEAKKRRLRFMHHAENVSQAPLDALAANVDEASANVAKRRATAATPTIIVASSMDIACPMVRSLELALPMLNGVLHVVIDPKGSPVEKDPEAFHTNSSVPLSVLWPAVDDLGAGGVGTKAPEQEPVDIGFLAAQNLPRHTNDKEPGTDPKKWRPKCFFESEENKKIVHFHTVDSQAERTKLLVDGGDGKTEYDPIALVEYVNRESKNSIAHVGTSVAAAGSAAAAAEADGAKSLTSSTFRNKAFVIQRRDFLLGQSLALEDFEEYQLEDHIVSSSSTATPALKGTILALLDSAPKRIGSIPFSSLWYAHNSYMTPYCMFERCYLYV